VKSPRSELEVYFDDPAAYEARQEKALIPLLCEKALAARKRGQALQAAADYNRALAYAPNDPSLLRIVASLHGAQARNRFLRRALPLAAGTLLLGVGAFALTRELRAHRPTLQPDSDPNYTATSAPASATDSALPPTPSAAPSAKSKPNNTSVAISVASPQPQSTKPPAAKPGVHEIKFTDVWPSNIVKVLVDGHEVLSELSADKTLPFTVDESPHKIRLICQTADGTGDYCEFKEIALPAGQAPASPMSAHLQFKQAKLNIIGNDGSDYYLDSDFNHKLVRGQNYVPMESLRKLHTVHESPSMKEKPLNLTAGMPSDADFQASTP
jgi:hypothetical protein